MKQRYSKVSILLTCLTLILYLPLPIRAQCLCADGSNPNTVSYQQTRLIRPIDDSTDFNLSQFDPAIGELVCVNVYSYLTSVVRMRLENDEIYPLNYRIAYTRTDQILGPGLSPSISASFSKNYGPYTLAESDGNTFSGPDYVFIGPDSVLKNQYLSRTISSNVVPFLGNGTLTYYYKLTGRTTVTGGVNYIFSVSSQDFVTVGVQYNYCITALLASGMADFNVGKKSKEDILLTWTTKNESATNKYVIEYSSNGRDFQTAGTVDARTVVGSTASKYEFAYKANQTAGKLYFRVKQVQSSGKWASTAIKGVSFDGTTVGGISVFPNPARAKFQMMFEQPITGDYAVELVNMSGQVMYNRTMSVQQSNVINLELNSQPPAGVYILRAKEVRTGAVYSSKVSITK